MNTELVSTDFASMAQRRVNKEGVDKGGWSIFITVWTGTDILNPAVNQLLRGAGTAGWFGWAKDDTLEALRNAWFDTADPAAQARIATGDPGRGVQIPPLHPAGLHNPLCCV